jgi:hypothetical protein
VKTKAFFLTFFTFISIFVNGQGCLSSFTSYQNGSIVSSYPLNVSGTVTRPNNGHVWILAHLDGFNGWYPQGNGERNIVDNNWTCTVYLGTPNGTGYYEIAIAIVNDQVNQTLNNWVSTAQVNGYPPIPFPGVLNNCAITTIRVEKR